MKKLKIFVCAAFLLGFGWMVVSRSVTVAGESASTSLAGPLGLSATDNLYNNKVGLYWEPVWGATTYRIFRNSINDPSGATDVGFTAANSFFDFSAPAGQTFFYWVRSESGSTIGSMSTSDPGSRANPLQQGPIPPLDPPPVPAG